MNEIIWLEPVYKEMIWGSEQWAISAHPNGDCKVSRGKYQGMNLSELWRLHPELFHILKDANQQSSDNLHGTGGQFPLLIKLIDAKDDLSIQVHPDDAYAAVHENGSLGKTECWYILDCKENAEIIIGHNAKDKEELKDMILNQRWNDLIRVIPIKKGDFFQIEPGCLHAIKGGTILLETQQSSDITYRVYDYDRLTDGKPRQLHVQESIDVLTTPYIADKTEYKITRLEGAVKTHLVTCPFYHVDLYEINGGFSYPAGDTFTNVTVLEGQGTVDGIAIEKGTSFIIPAGLNECVFSGEMKLICSHP